MIASARVVADQVDLLDAERVAQSREHVGDGREGDVLCRRDCGRTMTGKVHGDAPSLTTESADHVSPQVGAEEHAVHEQGNRPLADIDVGDVTEGG